MTYFGWSLAILTDYVCVTNKSEFEDSWIHWNTFLCSLCSWLQLSIGWRPPGFLIRHWLCCFPTLQYMSFESNDRLFRTTASIWRWGPQPGSGRVNEWMVLSRGLYQWHITHFGSSLAILQRLIVHVLLVNLNLRTFGCIQIYFFLCFYSWLEIPVSTLCWVAVASSRFSESGRCRHFPTLHVFGKYGSHSKPFLLWIPFHNCCVQLEAVAKTWLCWSLWMDGVFLQRFISRNSSLILAVQWKYNGGTASSTSSCTINPWC